MSLLAVACSTGGGERLSTGGSPPAIDSAAIAADTNDADTNDADTNDADTNDADTNDADMTEATATEGAVWPDPLARFDLSRNEDIPDEGFRCGSFDVSRTDMAAASANVGHPRLGHIGPDLGPGQSSGPANAQPDWLVVAERSGQALFRQAATTNFAEVDLTTGRTQQLWCNPSRVPAGAAGLQWRPIHEADDIRRDSDSGSQETSIDLDSTLAIEVQDMTCAPDIPLGERVLVSGVVREDHLLLLVATSIPQGVVWLCDFSTTSVLERLELDLDDILPEGAPSQPIRGIWDTSRWFPREVTFENYELITLATHTGDYWASDLVVSPDPGTIGFAQRAEVPVADLVDGCAADPRGIALSAPNREAAVAALVQALGLPADGWVVMQAPGHGRLRLVRSSGDSIVFEATFHDAGLHAAGMRSFFIPRRCGDEGGPAADTMALLDDLDPSLSDSAARAEFAALLEEYPALGRILGRLDDGDLAAGEHWQLEIAKGDRCPIIEATRIRLESRGFTASSLPTAALDGGTFVFAEFVQDDRRLVLSTETHGEYLVVRFDENGSSWVNDPPFTWVPCRLDR